MAIGYIDITLDRPRRIRFDLNALVEIENISQKSLTGLLTDLSLTTLRNLTWAGLKHEDRRLTRERTGELLQVYLENGGTTERLIEQLVDALEQSGVFKPKGNASRPVETETTG